MADYKKIVFAPLIKYKIHFILLGFFIIYILSVPRLAHFITPCLSGFSINPSNYIDCNLILALDRFMVLSFMGVLILDIIVFVSKEFKLKSFLMLNIAFGVLVIFAYYSYIPTAWRVVAQSETYLDTIR